MRKYFVNNKEVSVYIWREAFAQNIGASVILQTQQIPGSFKPPETQNVISPEKVRALHQQFKQIHDAKTKPQST